MPITAGPQPISLFHRTGPANRTANPLSVVLPQCTLMAEDQGGSVAGLVEQEGRAPSDVTVTGRLSTSGRVSRYVPGASTTVPYLSTRAWRSSPGLASARLGSGAGANRARSQLCPGNSTSKPLTVRRDHSQSHRLLALVAIRSEEQIGRLTVGTGLEDQRKGSRIIRNRCPVASPVNPGPPHRVGQHTPHDRNRGGQSGDRHMHVTRRPGAFSHPGRAMSPRGHLRSTPAKETQGLSARRHTRRRPGSPPRACRCHTPAST